MKYQNRRHSAFTLIELLVVIAIIAITCGDPVPCLCTGTSQSSSDLLHLEPETNRDSDDDVRSGLRRDLSKWLATRRRRGTIRHDDVAIWLCVPTFRSTVVRTLRRCTMLRMTGEFTPAHRTPANNTFGPTSYGYNCAATGMTNGWNGSAPGDSTNHYVGKALAAVRSSANLVAFCDAATG